MLRNSCYKKRMAEETDEYTPLEFERLKKFLIDVYPNNSEKGYLSLLTAGRRSGSDFSNYAQTVLSFDWQDFYQNWEGELYFEWLREEFIDEEIADVVLIDSRTGVTEIGGVCTYQLADVVVIFCAPNQQNISGVYEMAQNFTSSEVRELRGGRPLEIIVIPARLEGAEGDKLNEFKRDFFSRADMFAPSKFSKLPSVAEKLWSLSPSLRISYGHAC